MTSLRPLLAVGALLALGGCPCIGSEFTTSRTFSVHASAEDAPCSSDRVEVKLLEDKTFSDLRQYLGGVELRRVVVTVVNPKTREDSAATLANGTVRIASDVGGAALVLSTWGDVPVTQDATKDIPFDAATAATLSSLVLNPPHTFVVEGEGCANRVPAFFDFKVELTFYAWAGT